MWEKLNSLLKDDSVYYSLLVLLIGVGSFGLGRWSVGPDAVNSQPASITLSKSSDILHDIRTDIAKGVVADELTASPATSDTFVASKNGSKYHFPWCPGAKQMKEENKVWFDSKEAAEAAGYTPAANCKGL